MGVKAPTKNEAKYDADFYAWTEETARLLRERRFDEVAADVLAEEIEDMGKRESREVRSRMTRLLSHLLKWEYQPRLRGPSWSTTINDQRRELGLIFEDSATLRQKASAELEAVYQAASKAAASETRLPVAVFPGECPYTFALVLSDDFWPGPESGDAEA